MLKEVVVENKNFLPADLKSGIPVCLQLFNIFIKGIRELENLYTQSSGRGFWFWRGLQLHPDDGMGMGRHILELLLFHDLQALGNHLIKNKKQYKQYKQWASNKQTIKKTPNSKTQ